jgi:hypothetical protein
MPSVLVTFVSVTVMEVVVTFAIVGALINGSGSFSSRHRSRAHFINEYPSTKEYKRFEQVAHVQPAKAVAYIVFTADEKSAFEKHRSALEEAVTSLHSMNVDYPEKPKN